MHNKRIDDYLDGKINKTEIEKIIKDRIDLLKQEKMWEYNYVYDDKWDNWVANNPLPYYPKMDEVYEIDDKLFYFIDNNKSLNIEE